MLVAGRASKSVLELVLLQEVMMKVGEVRLAGQRRGHRRRRWRRRQRRRRRRSQERPGGRRRRRSNTGGVRRHVLLVFGLLESRENRKYLSISHPN